MNTTNTKERTVKVTKNDVYYDIDTLSLYYSEVSAGDTPMKADRIATETADDKNKKVIRHLCEHRASDIRQVLRKFIKSTTGSTTPVTPSYTDSDWSFALNVTTELEDNTLSTIADLCHDYIVSGALADFYAQVGMAGNRESLNLRADKALAQIRELIYFRPMP